MITKVYQTLISDIILIGAGYQKRMSDIHTLDEPWMLSIKQKHKFKY